MLVVWLVMAPSYLGVGASDKPGAVQFACAIRLANQIEDEAEAKFEAVTG